MKIVYTTNRLTSVPYDVVLHKTLDDALEYVHGNLGDWIDCRVTEEDMKEHGFTLHIGTQEMSDEDYDAVFNHGETLDIPGPKEKEDEQAV